MGVQQTQEATIKNLTEKRNKFIKKLIHSENINVVSHLNYKNIISELNFVLHSDFRENIEGEKSNK